MYLPGGKVSFSSEFNFIKSKFSPFLSFGTSVSSPRARVSTASQPGNKTLDPFIEKLGILSSFAPSLIFADTFVFSNFAGTI